MTHGIDIGRKLTLDEIDLLRARGFGFACRYYDGSAGASAKALSTSEVAGLLSRRIAVCPVFQSSGNFPGYFTAPQGQLDGAAARADALALGQPLGTPIPFAVDVDVSAPDFLVHYFNGVYAGLDGAYLPGVYGEFDVVRFCRENFPALSLFWQTYAWSRDLVYWAADIFQHANGVPLAPGLVVDLNIARTPLPWRIA